MTPYTSHPSHKAQRGLSLIELMVALTISVILSLGVFEIFSGSKQSYQIQEDLSRLQENARFAIDMMTRDIRMAGYTGCFDATSNPIENILNDQTNYGWDLSNLVQGYNAGASSWTPTLNAAIAGTVLTGTDVIEIRKMSSDGISLVPPFSDSAQLFVDPAGNIFVEGQILMVTDCVNASIFQISNIQTTAFGENIVHSASGTITPGNSTPLLANSYGADATVATLDTSVYYFAVNDDGNRSLFREALALDTATNTVSLQPQELVEGVENLQLLYGEDTDADGDANRYLSADSVTDMNSVVSVRIALLLQTLDEISLETDTSQYALLDENYDPADDRRLRRTFTTTIRIRNR